MSLHEPLNPAPAADDLPAADAASAARMCAYCQAEVDATAAVSCPTCLTPYHADCWHDGQGCTVMGCGARRDTSEPRTAPAPAPASPSWAEPPARPRAASTTPRVPFTRVSHMAVAVVLLFGLPAIAVHATTHNWLSGITGTVYLQPEVDDIRDDAEADGYRDGQEDGYGDGYTEGAEDGYGQGYDDGYDDGYSEGQTSGYLDGYDDGSDYYYDW